MEARLKMYDDDGGDITSIEKLLAAETDETRTNNKLLDSCKIERWFMDVNCKIERLTFKEHGVFGSLFLPPGEGPHPGESGFHL